MNRKNVTTVGGAAVIALALVGCSGGSAGTSTEAAGSFGRCSVTDTKVDVTLDTMEAGVLTMAVPLPTPGYYQGDTPETVDGGYAYCLAAEVASRAGLDSIEIRNTTYETFMTGRATDFDMTIYDVIIKPERAEIVDFSVPYRTMKSAILAKSDSDWTQETLRDARIGVLSGSVLESYVNEYIKPAEVRSFSTTPDMTQSLLAGQVDVILNDFESMAPLVAEFNDKYKIVGLLPGGDLGAVLPKASGNTEAINTIIESMLDDGTMDAIEKEWLLPLTGGLTPVDYKEWDYQ